MTCRTRLISSCCVAIEIEDRRRSAAERRHHRDLSRLAAAQLGAEILLQAIELEPWRVRPAAAARLDAERELRVDELAAAVVQQQRVDAVAMRIIHARGDEDVIPAVRIDVADARSPWPVSFRAGAIGDLLEPAAAGVMEQRVAENERVRRAAENLIRRRDRRLLLLEIRRQRLEYV